MAFKLDSVVPWGRNLEEYKLMFGLDDRDCLLYTSDAADD